MKTLWKILFVALVAAAAFLAGRWQLPSGAQAGAPARKILYWYDPMHPSYRSDKPGIAPDCGMRLEPKYADQGAANEHKHEAAEQPPGTIHITPEKQQLIGVRYGVVEMGSATEEIRAVGKVDMDETRTTRVHSRVDGWIEKVFVDFTGQQVKAGQPMLTIYSPEMLATQQEYVLALESRALLKQSVSEHAAHDTERLVEAALRRLETWNLSPEQIQELERTKKPLRTTTLYAPASGVVTARNAFPNQRITADTDLYTLVDLSRVWVNAEVFESDAGMVRMGQRGVISLSYQPERAWSAAVTYVLPQVDPNTRTLKVRLEADNPRLALKPGMFVNVVFPVRSAPRMMVPSDAVLDSGLKKTVFVDRGDGYLEPRQVETGQHFGDRVEVLHGLKPGERIVTSGNFLIDSESQLKAAAGGMGEHRHD
jgi:membrane fusion protein, copper/silver efflux system